ncbi:sulfatase-like hydrolase/transferase [Pseudomarimonas arenosa]|uniref:Sulfatase-like hydrolase/transferase n=1 Tax=Pseudomarimonas arenosa TaxID=2774145 RepID=A0AAW3ZL65_9GAMM|nr:sulfatase-like hydrolase/transferase [Pseudomarimonas arenosa]MBD8526478.1 sulfatase-like hydrolase/transferase [Pseudomarimonas arenosa]
MLRAFTRTWLTTAIGCVILVSLALQGCSTGEPRWNVLLVTFDTTRPDHLGPYGATRASTPTLDRLAAEGFVFEQAFSAAPITAPSHSTMLTGKYPIAHGFRDNGLFVLGEDQLTLPEILREHGYATAAAVGAYPVIAKFGFSQGFDLFDDNLTGHIEDHLGERIAPKERLFFDERRAAQVNEAVLPWLNQTAQAGKPFFVWLHYFDPHQPFEPPAPFDQKYADDLYSGEISYTDQALGRLLAQMERLGVLENTLVVMAADHGEGLGEHGEVTHAVLAYNSTLQVPLIVRPPEVQNPGGRISERVGTVDIAPTILELLGIEVPEQMQGRSLAPLMRGELGEWRQYYAENLSPHMSHGWGKLRVLFDGNYKYIHGPRPELYDLEADPKELSNLIEDDQDQSTRMHEELSLFLKEFASGASVTAPLDAESIRMLQSLGYLQGGASGQTTVSEELEPGGVAPHLHVGLINDMSAAKHLLFAQRYGDAEVYTRKLIAASPDSHSYIEMHLAALVGGGKSEEAWAYLNAPKAIDFKPSESIITGLALARSAQGQEEEAADVLGRFAAAHCSARAYWVLADMPGYAQDAGKRWQALNNALQCDEHFARARIDLAVELARGDRQAEAEAEFRTALQHAPYEPIGWYNFGTFLLAEGRLDEAEGRFARAVELAPQYRKARLALIATAVERGELGLAEERLRGLERDAPNSPEAAAGRALMGQVASP